VAGVLVLLVELLLPMSSDSDRRRFSKVLRLSVVAMIVAPTPSRSPALFSLVLLTAKSATGLRPPAPSLAVSVLLEKPDRLELPLLMVVFDAHT